MSTNGKDKQPLGYGHDNKGAAVGGAVGQGKPTPNMSPDEGTAKSAMPAAAHGTFFMDDKEIDIRPGETIFTAGRRHGIKVPHLCYTPKPGYRPDGNCRVCVVEVEGERVLAASCI